MAERPDLRQIAVSIGEALEGFERDDLAKMLTYVFKEYVVEGAPPVLVSQVDGIDALDGLSFAELIEQLQARLDLPELEHFSVQGDSVQVRVGGVLQSIGGGERPGSAMRATPAAIPAAPPPAAGAPPTPTPTPTPTTSRPVAEEAVRRGRGDLAGGRRGAPAAPAARGLSDQLAAEFGRWPRTRGCRLAAAKRDAPRARGGRRGSGSRGRRCVGAIQPARARLMPAASRRYFLRGKAAIAAGDHAEAAEALSAAVELSPRFVAARLAFAAALAHRGDCPRAAQTLRAGLGRKSTPLETAALWATLGDVLVRSGDFLGAEDSFSQAEAHPAFVARVAAGRARLFAKTGRYPESFAALLNAANA